MLSTISETSCNSKEMEVLLFIFGVFISLWLICAHMFEHMTKCTINSLDLYDKCILFMIVSQE